LDAGLPMPHDRQVADKARSLARLQTLFRVPGGSGEDLGMYVPLPCLLPCGRVNEEPRQGAETDALSPDHCGGNSQKVVSEQRG
jgi:hypothetical protein